VNSRVCRHFSQLLKNMEKDCEKLPNFA